MLDGIVKRQPGIDDIVDQQDLLSGDVFRQVAEQFYIPGTFLVPPVTAEPDEFHFQRHAVAVELADQVGNENKAALEDTDNHEIALEGAADFFGQFLDPGRDFRFVV